MIRWLQLIAQGPSLPWWKFWHPRSGFWGGLVFAALFWALLFVSGVVHAQDAPTQGVAVGQKLPPVVNYGFTGGMLAIPFKFHPSDHALTGGGTVGGYVGWRSEWMGLTLTPIVSAGLTMSDATYGTGFSVASGFIGSIANSPIHLGLVYGVDWYAKTVKYPYDGKLWLAIEVGYNFGQ